MIKTKMVKGSDEAKAWAKKMQEARAAKKLLKEQTVPTVEKPKE